MNDPSEGNGQRLTPASAEQDRFEILEQLRDWLETPMIVLGFVWLALLVVELIWGLAPLLESISTVIWLVFIADFVLRLSLAPRRIDYLRRNWLEAISLALPALRVIRVVRVLRVARAARGLRLVRILSSFNRGLRTVRTSMRRRGFGYVVALTLLVIVIGAAGMYAFEAEASGGGFSGYGDALWWTAMLLTSLGSEYWPQTPEGRVLCLALAFYGFAVFGYITATIATVFINQDAQSEDSDVAGAAQISALQAEIQALRAEMQRALSR